MKQKHLSKTRIKQGLQCPKSLYLQLNSPELAEKPSPQQKNIFEQGKMVHREAYKTFPDRVELQAPYWDFDEAARQTKKALADKARVICEAFFAHEGLNARIDVLKIEKDESWSLIEVKHSSSVKKDHIWDIAIQKYIVEQAGRPVQKCFVMHINRDCVFPNLKNLFIRQDVTDEVDDLQEEVKFLVQELKKTVDGPGVPKISIGPHCKKPYPCPFISHCWGDVPSPSVFDIPAIGELAWEYYNKNQVRLADVPQSDLTKRQCMYQDVHLKGGPFIDKKSIEKEISKWEKPFYYLDFETISAPIPRFEGTRPFQHIPFQFSLLWQGDLSEELKEKHYLHEDLSDPRRPLAEELVQAVGERGSVAAYYKNFESGRLSELAELFPDLKEALLNIQSRLVDPLPLLQNFVCFKEFASSWSMKSTAPVLLGEKWDYGRLQVQDGLMAQNVFKEMAPMAAGDSHKEKMKKDLIEYCRQDTVCLALIVKRLFNEAC